MAPNPAVLRRRLVIGALIASTMFAATAPSVPAAPIATRSGPMAAVPVNGAFNNAGLQKEVYAFAPYWALPQEATWNYTLMSTLVYFGLVINWDGSWIMSGSGWNGYHSSQLVDMVNRAHGAGDRVLLSIEDNGQSALNDIVTVPAYRDLVVANVVSAIAYKNLDGVNIDFEGTSTGYPSIQSGLTAFATQLAAAVHAASPHYLVTIDTYTGSASWDGGLMNITQLAPVVDAMFIMSYDMSFSNMSGQAGPNAPLTGWTYNDELAVSQYLTKAPASKIILAVPWYGYRFKTTSGLLYAHATNAYAESYTKVQDRLSCASNVVKFWDAPSHSVWLRWWSPSSGDPCGINDGSWEELWYDDVRSLGDKYDLVNRTGIRGVGIWALGFDGGAPELWSELNTYFSCPAQITLPATETTTEFALSISTGTCSVRSYDVQQYDSTQNGGWYTLKSNVAYGFPGYSYDFRVRSHSMAGVTSAWAYASTTVATDATTSLPFKGLYTIDDYGGMHADQSPPLSTGAYFSGWKIIRAGHALPGTEPVSGATLDGFGGFHAYGASLTLSGSPYWRGWDIARDFAFLADGSGGYVLDGFGGLHPFGVNGHAAPPAVQGAAYWPGRDVARKLALFSDGSGGYVLDAYGGLHAFGIGRAAPAAATGGPYWSGQALARDLVLVPGTHAGYVLDAFGGIHGFSGAAAVSAPAYWKGWDIARGLWLLPSSTTSAPAGYVLDGLGGLHEFGGAPRLSGYDYWPGNDVAHNLAGF